jgi:dihydrofolate synthase/folylpolyglutamate synthase
MANRDLAQWLKWIKTYHDKSINYDLANVGKVAAYLAVEKFSMPVITVAGTNGKGSCIASMEALLIAHGYKVGAYTSPHMFQFNERIRINRQPITELKLCAAMQQVHVCLQTNQNINLSPFEFATLAALLIFKQNHLDFILLEVGLGGRLDAVNVVTNDVAVITSISLDHCAYLGKDRESIAYEKAGIIKPNAKVIFAELDMPHSAKQQATEQNAKLLHLGDDYHFIEHELSWDWHKAELQFSNLPLPKFPIQNAAAALAALSLLPALHLQSNIVRKVFAELKISGRFQVELLADTEFIFDVAHNPAAIIWLINKLAQRPSAGKTLVIFAVASTKDSLAMLQAWKYPVSKWLICAPHSMRRATPVEKLAKELSDTQLSDVQIGEDIAHCFQLARAQTEPGDRVVVCGSFHTVADALTEFYKVVNI